MEFIDKLKRDEKIGVSFYDNLQKYFDENKVNKDIQTLIKEVI
jgi:uncharacterized protein YeeX (DUF496 family)